MSDREPTAKWNAMREAPRDGSEITLRVGRRKFRGRWQGGFIGEDEADCSTWIAVVEDDHPRDWHDGVCWSSNVDGNPSTYPNAWRPA